MHILWLENYPLCFPDFSEKLTYLKKKILTQKRGRRWGRQADAEKKEQGYRQRTGFTLRWIQIRIYWAFTIGRNHISEKRNGQPWLGIKGRQAISEWDGSARTTLSKWGCMGSNRRQDRTELRPNWEET